MSYEEQQYESPEQAISAIQDVCLTSYSKEIMPRVRQIADLKEELKEYQEGIEGVSELQQVVTDAKKELAEKIASDDNVIALTEQIKSLSKELTQALKAASKGVNKQWKPKELKAFFEARNKAKVQPTVEKGEMFATLDSKLQEESL